MLDLAAIKNDLNVTYDDPRVDDKIAAIITRAEYHIREICAIPEGDELTPTEEQLTRDCCRYIYNEVFAAFESDHMGTINGCRARRLAAGYAAASEDGENNAG